jgi:hypothetical protein
MMCIFVRYRYMQPALWRTGQVFPMGDEAEAQAPQEWSRLDGQQWRQHVRDKTFIYLKDSKIAECGFFFLSAIVLLTTGTW